VASNRRLHSNYRGARDGLGYNDNGHVTPFGNPPIVRRERNVVAQSPLGESSWPHSFGSRFYEV
jgi:hypothetical protein